MIWKTSLCSRAAALLTLALLPAWSIAAEQPSAVVLVYHHVAEDTPASTSVSPAVFQQHLDYLHERDYQVLPLEQIVAALINRSELPERAVAITFDDAARSIYSEAWPRLRARGWHFTIFANTNYIDRNYGNYLSWEQLRELEANGASIANHGAEHDHLVRRRSGESEQQWAERVRADIQQAQQRLEAELARPLDYFAYPYGEFDADVEAIIENLGIVAFGQQSGAVGPYSDLQQLPRFPMAASYAELGSFAEKIRTRALPVVEVIEPHSRILGADAAAPKLRLRLAEGNYQRQQLRCYLAGQEPPILTWQQNLLSIQAQQPLRSGRSKFNCTAPALDANGVFYWYSYLWLQKRPNNHWYSE